MKPSKAPAIQGAISSAAGKPTKPPQAQSQALPANAQAAMAAWQAQNAGRQPIRAPFSGPTSAGIGRVQFQQDEAMRQQRAAQQAAQQALAAKMTAPPQQSWWNEATGGQ